jgi:CubicO group peptidase (beta-lactamase class C family)
LADTSPADLSESLRLIDSWPVPAAAAAVIDSSGRISTWGPTNHSFQLASLSKVLSTWAILVAVEEGTIGLDTPIGQPNCTLAHLLAHAGGYAFDGPNPITRPARKRIYSNTGIELAADAVAQATGLEFGIYLAEAIFEPLGMTCTELRGSPAAGVTSTVADLCSFVAEILQPTLLSKQTVSLATSVQFAELDGLVPGVGSFRPCPWGLGVEIHGHKQPHWMGLTNTPQAFGHFGGSGTMMWIEPQERTALIALTNRRFDQWSSAALQLWPQMSDSVLTQLRRDR